MEAARSYAAENPASEAGRRDALSTDVVPNLSGRRLRYANKTRLLALADRMEKELRENIWPFWMKHAFDTRDGGVFAHLDRQGKPRDTVKFLVGQARMIYVLSHVSMLYPQYRETFLPKAKALAKFMLDKYWDTENKGWYWSLENGIVKEADKRFYAHIFAIYGLATYLRASNDKTVEPYLQKTFLLLQTKFYNPQADIYLRAMSRDWQNPSLDRINMGDHLHYLEAMLALQQALPQEVYRKEIRHAADIVWNTMMDDSVGVPYEFFDLRSGQLKVQTKFPKIGKYWGKNSGILCTGHQMEHAFLLMKAARFDQARPYIRRGVNLLEQTLKLAWQPDTYPFGIREWYRNEHFFPLVRWWTQPEGINACANAYLYTGDRRYIDRVESLWNTYQLYYMDREFGGEFKFAFSEKNLFKRTPKQLAKAKDKGMGVGNCYHTTRGLTNAIFALRQAADKFTRKNKPPENPNTPAIAKIKAPLSLRQFGDTSKVAVVTIAKPETAVKLRSNFYGLNIGAQLIKKPAGYFSNVDYDENVRLWGSQTARFMGSTLANFFDWERRQLDEKVILEVGHSGAIRGIRNQIRANNGKKITINFPSYFRFCERNNLQSIMCLNVYTRDAEHSIAAIRRVKKIYPHPVFWEMGNEIDGYNYNINLAKKYPWDIHLYIKRCKKISDVIRKEFPEDKIGVCTHTIINERALVDHPRAIVEKLELWEEELRKHDFFDAIIIHPYIHEQSFKQWKNKYFAQLPDKWTDEQIKSELHYARLRWIFASSQNLPRLYSERLKQHFPGKTFWITESAIHPDKRGTTKGILVNRTVVASVFNVGYFLNWLRFHDQVEIFQFFTLGSGNGWPHSRYKDKSLNANSVGYAMIKRALTGAQKVRVLDFSDGPSYAGIARFQETHIAALTGGWFTHMDGDRLLLANAGDAAIRLSFPFKDATVHYYAGDIEQEILPGDIPNVKDLFRIDHVPGQWKMPPWSVAVIVDTTDKRYKFIHQ